MPDWDASNLTGQHSKLSVRAAVSSNGFDSYSEDNSTSSEFYLTVGRDDSSMQEFALDDGGNDIPFITDVPNSGIGFNGSSGSFAMKFTLAQADTLYGTRIYFASAYSAEDPVRISVLDGDTASCIPGVQVWQLGTETAFVALRTPVDSFVAYYFPKPIALSPGVYWLSVSQLLPANMMIGGDVSRGVGRISVADSRSPQMTAVYSSPYGSQWSSSQNSGDIRCSFAVEAPESTNWMPWMPERGWWPSNRSANLTLATTWDPLLDSPYVDAGTYLPMIRPIVGKTAEPSHVSDERSDEFALEIEQNPFALGDNINELSFTLTKAGKVTLIVYDVNGRPVRTLVNDHLNAERHVIYWKGDDEGGRSVAPGVYMIRLTYADHVVPTSRIVVLP
jgi:hypothetical protein